MNIEIANFKSGIFKKGDAILRNQFGVIGINLKNIKKYNKLSSCFLIDSSNDKSLSEKHLVKNLLPKL